MEARGWRFTRSFSSSRAIPHGRFGQIFRFGFYSGRQYELRTYIGTCSSKKKLIIFISQISQCFKVHFGRLETFEKMFLVWYTPPSFCDWISYTKKLNNQSYDTQKMENVNLSNTASIRIVFRIFGNINNSGVCLFFVYY